MTSEFLKSYTSKKEEIKELTYKLETMGDSLIGNDVIFDYRSGYPVPQSVVGVDRDKYFMLEQRYKSRRQQLIDECRQTEEFVENIQDSLTRRIFRQRFIEGKTQEQMALDMHISQSSISKKICHFLKME